MPSHCPARQWSASPNRGSDYPSELAWLTGEQITGSQLWNQSGPVRGSTHAHFILDKWPIREVCLPSSGWRKGVKGGMEKSQEVPVQRNTVEWGVRAQNIRIHMFVSKPFSLPSELHETAQGNKWMLLFKLLFSRSMLILMPLYIGWVCVCVCKIPLFHNSTWVLFWDCFKLSSSP